jgi:hypothetical protein
MIPADDSGYGFDNIGDVLRCRPAVEKLMSAAQRISRVAVYGEPYPAEPSLLVKIKPKKSLRMTARLRETSFHTRCVAPYMAFTIFQLTASMSFAGGTPICAVRKSRYRVEGGVLPADGAP